MNTAVTGAVQPKISQSNLKNLSIVVPTIEVAKSFSQLIKPYFDYYRQNNEEIRALTALKDQLISELIRK